MSNNELLTLFGRDNSRDHDSIAEAGRAVLDARVRKEQAEERLKESNKLLDQAEMALLTKMQIAGCISIKIDDGGTQVTLSSSSSTYYSSPAGALEDPRFFTWLLSSGGHDLVKRTIHHASFSSFCRELVAQEKILHPLVKVAIRKTVSVRR